MKAGKKALLLTAILAVGVITCGCAVKNPSSQNANEIFHMADSSKLNDRQKEILTQLGLSTDYSELTSTQQRGIMAIEEMLEGVEEKYGIEFAYAGYTSGTSLSSPLEGEELFAYPADGDKETQTFSVTRNEDGTFSDTYPNIASIELFSEYISEPIAEYFGTNSFKAYPQVNLYGLDTIPEANSDFDGSTYVSLSLFIDGAQCSEDQFETAAQEFEAWMNEHEITGTMTCYLLKEGVFDELPKTYDKKYCGDEYIQMYETKYL